MKLKLEPILTLLVVAGFANVIYRFIADGRLPQPFMFDVYDTFMDWYNTASWANNRGAYDVWRSVYPPISFVLLKIFSIHSCYAINSVRGRDCDPVGWITMSVCYVIVCFVAARAFRHADRATYPFRSIAYALSFPLLFTFERGNLIIITLIFFIVAYGGTRHSRWLKALSIGMTLNFKPYLVIPSLALGLKRRWLMLELSAFFAILIYAVSYAWIGTGSPSQIIANTAYFVEMGQGLIWEQIYFTTTLKSFLPFDTYLFPTRDFLPDKVLEWFFFFIPIVVNSTVALCLVAIAGSALQPRALSTARNAALLLGCYLIWSSPGGYTQTFLFFLVFLEKRDSVTINVALIMTYLLSIPYDYVATNVFFTGNHSWLSGKPVVTWFGLNVGIFLRPVFLIVLMWALAVDSIVRVAQAHRLSRPTLQLRRTNAGINAAA